jgi:imidazolonepropionase-like amidohydrolase
MRAGLGCLLVAMIGGGGSASPATTLIVAHVAVVDVLNGISRPDQTVVIRGPRIERVAPARSVRVPATARVLDGTGKYLLPGLWDMHVHAGGDERALQAMLAAGITGVRDMGGDFARLAEVRRRIETGRADGPRIVGAGPMLRGPKSPMDVSDAESLVVRTPEEGRRAVETLSTRGVDFVKVHEDLTRDAFRAIAAAARAKGMPFVGHVPAGVTPAEASDLGQLSIEHLEFVPDSCILLFTPEARAAGTGPPDACGPSAMAALLRHLARNGTWLDPTIASFRYWAPAQWEAIFGGFRDLTPAIRRSGVRILAGTDWSDSLQSRGAAPGASLHDELALLVEAGFSPAEVLRSATSNPARLLGLSRTLGTVEAGKTADLLLLDADPFQDIRNTRRVAAVIRDGRVVQAPGVPVASLSFSAASSRAAPWYSASSR